MGRGSSNGRPGSSGGGGAGGRMNGSSKSTIDAIMNLPNGSQIEVEYSYNNRFGSGTYTDTFEKKSKSYAMGGTMTAWVKTGGSGWMYDFGLNRLAIESELRNTTVTIKRRGR